MNKLNKTVIVSMSIGNYTELCKLAESYNKYPSAMLRALIVWHKNTNYDRLIDIVDGITYTPRSRGKKVHIALDKKTYTKLENLCYKSQYSASVICEGILIDNIQ